MLIWRMKCYILWGLIVGVAFRHLNVGALKRGLNKIPKVNGVRLLTSLVFTPLFYPQKIQTLGNSYSITVYQKIWHVQAI